MEKKNFERVLEENSIDVCLGRYKLINDCDRDERFSIICVDPCLLHPELTNEELVKRELYRLKTKSELSRGQFNFELQCLSKEELIEVYLYLVRKGYKYTRILYQSTRQITRVFYSIRELEDDIKGFRPGIHDILEVVVNLKDLDKFKKDIRDLRTELGYKNVWLGRFNDYWKVERIID